MSVLHCLAAYGQGALTGLQSTQRDFSPFLAHFTRYSAMARLRRVVVNNDRAADVPALFREADAESWKTVQAIVASQTLLATSPGGGKHIMPPCVCLSECTLPGLISHCERYGRFGFVFSKEAIFRAGGRPCLYVGNAEFRVLAEHGRGLPPSTPEGRLYALANVFEMPRGEHKLQDYTHEREWRLFESLDLRQVKMAAMLAPTPYTGLLLELGIKVPIIPIDTLFDWGA